MTARAAAAYNRDMRRLPGIVVLSLALSACATSQGEGDTDKASKSGGKADDKAQPAEPEVAAEDGGEAEAKAEAKAEAGGEAEAGDPPPGVKVKGNLPVRTESELAAEAEARDACVTQCVQAHVADAKAPEAIDADCQHKCMQEHPIEQVEVVPDSPE